MKKFAVVGFPKCGTMSLVEYLKKKHPGCYVTRPENIYLKYKPEQRWKDYECVAITRDPVDRIHSGQQYFGALHRLTLEQLVNADWNNSDKYVGVGFADPIKQSHYKLFIQQFNANYGVKVKVYRFEDLADDPDFPHTNKSPMYIPWSKSDKQYVREQLEKRGITYP